MILNTISRLLTPIDYLRIRHPVKHRYDITIPFIFGSLIYTTYFFLPYKPILLGSFGLIEKISNLLSILSGFYIASLAAVATFESANLDSQMDGTKPTLRIRDNKIEFITRRRFLCLLFSYLVFLSMFLLFSGFLAQTISQNLFIITPKYYNIIKHILIGIYTFFFCQLVTITFFGIFYISDKIHRKPND